MQSDAERTPTLKANTGSEEQTPCSCNACYPRKDFGSAECITVPHPRDIYNHQRLVGFGSHIPIVPYAPVEYPGSPARLYRAPFNLHRPSYPRAMFSPAGPESRIYDLPRMQDMSKQSGPHENQLVQSQALQLQPNSGTSGRVWEQARGSGSREKSRRMRTVFTPEQLDRLERHFKCQQYVGSAQRMYIAKQLGLSETQVKVWFQNRRIRWRKQVLGAAVKSQS